MTDLIKKFSGAVRTISSDSNTMRECVYAAYRDYLRKIKVDDLPQDIRIIFESVADRLVSLYPPGDIGEDEAAHLADDILYMAEWKKANSEKL